jgi:hypothetical protein
MIFPGTPQSLPQLPPPPQLPQLMPPPQLPQLMPPPPGAPVNISFDNMFGSMLENMLMPREYGFKTNSYAVDMLDDDVMDSLPPAEQNKYLEKKLKPQIEKELKDIEFDNEGDYIKFSKDVVSSKTAKSQGTRHANKLWPFDNEYKDNENYKANYISRLQEIISQDSINTRNGNKTNTKENKEKAKELLKAIGVKPEYVPPPPTIAEIPSAKSTPQLVATKPPPPPTIADHHHLLLHHQQQQQPQQNQQNQQQQHHQNQHHQEEKHI